MKEHVPAGFPPLTLSIMRALCAVTLLHPVQEGQAVLIRCLDALFHAFWVEHRKTNEKDVLAMVLDGILGSEQTAKG